MEINKIKRPIVVNSFWNIGGKVVTMFITPLFAILIARILQPSDYGIYGIAFAVISFINIIKDLGISQAIIIAKNDEDYTSIQFTLQIVLGLLIYGLVLLTSPFIADLYKIEEFEYVLNIYSLIIFVWALEFPLVTYYLKMNNYRFLFYRQIIPSFLFGVIALSLAQLDFGVYSLVLGQLISQLFTALFLFWKTNLQLKIYFSFIVFKKLFSLGKHILIQSLSGFLVSSADSLVIGKNLGVTNLGFFKMGMNLTNLFPNALVPQIQQVVFTELSEKQLDHKYIAKRYYQFNLIVGISALLISLITFFLAPILVPIILGDKWIMIIPIIQLISISLPTGLLVGINNDLSKILGFNKVYSYFSVIRAITTITLLFIGSLYSLSYALFAWVFVSLIANIVNDILFFSNQKIIKYPISRFIIFGFTWSWVIFTLINTNFKF